MGKNSRFAFPLDIKLALDELFELRFPLRVSVRSGARRGSKNVSLNTARSSKSFLDQMHLCRDIKEIGLSSFRLNLLHARDIFQREATTQLPRDRRHRAKIQQKKMADVYTELSVIKLPLVIMTYKNVLYIRNELSQHRL